MPKHMTVNRVGHVHDMFCRCRECKPPMAQVQALYRLKVALIFAGIFVGTLIMVRVA